MAPPKIKALICGFRCSELQKAVVQSAPGDSDAERMRNIIDFYQKNNRIKPVVPTPAAK